MRGSAMKNCRGIWRTAGAAIVAPAAWAVVATLAGFAGLLLPGAAFAQGQDKSAPASSMQKLGRAPVNKEILRVQLPRPTVVKLKNGLTIVLEEDHKLPTIAFTMWIRPGQLADPGDFPGLGAFSAGMLREGTDKRKSEQIASEVDSLGATLEASSRFGVSYTSVNASGLISDTAKILDLMSDVVLHPSFPAGELAKYKQSEGAGLEQRLANPQFLGQQGFKRVVYGDTPMALASATKESIEKISVEDLKRFHDKHYVPGNAILGVTGDFTASEMRATIEKYFGAWVGAAEAAEKFAVEGPQAPLFLDLREEHSLTYGAYSRFNAEIYPGDWLAFAPVRTPVTGDAMERFLYEFKKINNEPVPQGEMDDAHRAIIASFAISLEQPREILNDWLTVQYYGLPVDYWDKYPDHIAGIDAAGVQASAKKFVDLDHLQWICVGDRKEIEGVLKKYGTVNVVDVTGKAEN